MSLLTVKIFQNNVDAHLFKARLESQDIQCYLFDENINSMDMIYGVAVGGIKVKVNSSDTEKVKKVLSDMEEEQRKQSLFIKCPVCKSTEYYKNFISIQGWKAFFAVLVAFITFSYPVYQKIVYKCKKCEHEFKKDEVKKIE